MQKTRVLLTSITCLTAIYALHSQVSYEQVQHRLKYLVKDSSLLAQVKVTAESVSMYAPGKTIPEITVKLKDSDEYIKTAEVLLPEERLALYQDYMKIQSDHDLSQEYFILLLDRLRERLGSNLNPTENKPFVIALDPGHWAANFTEAQWEKKYLKFSGTQLGRKEDVKFHESELAWKTAYVLKAMLENDGHVVFMTREQGKSCTGDTYSSWYDRERFKCLDSALILQLIDTASYLKFKTYNKNQLARSFFNTWDFYVRTRFIHRINPHLVLVMHYNVDEKNKPDQQGNFRLHDHNYSMVFIPGSYAKGELNTPEDRMTFLYFLLSNRLEKSAEFSRHIQQALVDSLKVPAADSSHTLSYLQNYSLLYENIPGIYCRNLYLTRHIFSTIAFAEPLLQDNREEAQRLSINDCEYQGIAMPCRVIEVARAYYWGIMRSLK